MIVILGIAALLMGYKVVGTVLITIALADWLFR